MRVLLVYSNRTRDVILAPPIGVSYVATATRNAGHDVRFLDLLTARTPAAALRDTLLTFRPDVVGLSVRNIDNVVHQRLQRHLGDLADYIRIIRETASRRVPIVLGGPAISVLGHRALTHLDADFAVRGEGEITFPALLAALESGSDPGSIPGVCTRDSGAVVPTRLPKFGASGMQDWIDWRTYARNGGTFAIQSKRGCPMSCSYCSYPDIEGRKMRRREPGEVCDEMEAVVRAIRPRAFEFVDSTFNLPQSHAIEICEEIVRRRLRVSLTTMGINPRACSPELFRAMKAAGFNSMMITPEAGSETMLHSFDKGFDLDAVIRTANLARKSGITSAWFFMLGGPGETRATVNETLRFIERYLRDRSFLSVITTGIRILPGTRLAEAHAPDRDLLSSTFYFSPDVSEAWILARINETIARQPNVVHAAEERPSTYKRITYRALDLFGVAPPYWRFTSATLCLPPVHALRRRRPFVGEATAAGVA